MQRIVTRATRRLILGTLTAVTLLVAEQGLAHAASPTVFPIPTPDSAPLQIVSGPDGALYFSESNTFQIGRVTTSGQFSASPVPEGPSDTNPGEGPDHIVSSGGYLWFTTNVGESIYRMTTAGALTNVGWDGSDAIGLGPADDGGIWIYDQLATNGAGQSIDVQHETAGLATTPCQTDDMNQVFAPMVLGANGSEWYAEDTTEGDYLVELNDACTQELKLPIPTADATYQVTSLAFSSNGTLWFTEHDEFNYNFPVGGAIGELAPGSTTPQLVWSESDEDNDAPTSLTPGADGTMYFAATDGIGQVTSAGAVTIASVAPYNPASVAIGSDGNLWFVDSTANAVGAIAPGSLFGVATGTPSPPVSTGPGPVVLAPTPRLSLPPQTLRELVSRRRLEVRCSLTGAGTCTVTAERTARTARRLHLRVPRHARFVRLARGVGVLTRGGRVTLTLRLSRSVARELGHARALSISLQATSSQKGAVTRRASRSVTLRR